MNSYYFQRLNSKGEYSTFKISLHGEYPNFTVIFHDDSDIEFLLNDNNYHKAMGMFKFVATKMFIDSFHGGLRFNMIISFNGKLWEDGIMFYPYNPDKH